MDWRTLGGLANKLGSLGIRAFDLLKLLGDSSEGLVARNSPVEESNTPPSVVVNPLCWDYA